MLDPDCRTGVSQPGYATAQLWFSAMQAWADLDLGLLRVGGALDPSQHLRRQV